ncbi:MAG: adenylate/guanylate cyclase domain-containing protein [Gemmatimonadota bacterium]
MPHRATMPHRLAAVWFADIVGYGRLSSRNENDALQLVIVFQRTCRDVVRRHNGRLVKFMGDAAMAEFPSTESAVLAACSLESTFRARASTLELDLEPPRLHIGLHVGEIATAPDGDIYGEGLNLASRLQDLAGPGQVLVSEDVRRQLHQRPEFRFVPLGERAIPDSDFPISVFSVVARAGAGEMAAVAETEAAWWRALHGELVRRRVYAAGAVYLVVAAAVVTVSALVAGRFDGPAWMERGAVLAAVLGLPIAIFLAWTFEIGRGGLRRHDPVDPSQTDVRPGLAFAAVVLLVAAVAGMISFVRPPVSGEVPAELPANRIAVLYFEDISPGGNLGHLVNGLTEGLIHELSGVPGLEVISRNGVRPFKEVVVPVDSMARALGAGTFVQGSVSESAGILRVLVELVDGPSGTVLESQVVERPRGELFALQDDVTEQVGNFLRRRLGEEIRLAEMRAETESVRAWELVQLAERFRDEATSLVQVGALDEAGRLYDRTDSLLAVAQAADTSWVRPGVRRGWLAHERAEWSQDSDLATARRWNEVGMDFARAALEIDPGDPDALELRGALGLWRALFVPEREPAMAMAQLDEAEADLRAAVEINPQQAGAWSGLSRLLAAEGKRQEARDAAARAYEADAYLRRIDDVIWRLFQMSYDLNQPVEAERWCEEGGRRFPEDTSFVACRIWLMTMPEVPTDPARAYELLNGYYGLVPPQDEASRKTMEMGVATVLARAGLPDSALAVAQRARGNPAIDPARELMYFEAFTRTVAGQEESAVELLEAYLEASPGQRREVAVTWWFDSLSDRPDFRALVGEPADDTGR